MVDKLIIFIGCLFIFAHSTFASFVENEIVTLKVDIKGQYMDGRMIDLLYTDDPYYFQILRTNDNDTTVKVIEGPKKHIGKIFRLKSKELDAAFLKSETIDVVDTLPNINNATIIEVPKCEEGKKNTPCKDTLTKVKNSTKWISGCEVLQYGTPEISDKNIESLQKCIANIKKKVASKCNRDIIYTNLYTKLNPVEQHFAGLIFTSHAETRGNHSKVDSKTLVPEEILECSLAASRYDVKRKSKATKCGYSSTSIPDMMMIMKVIENRKRITNEGTPSRVLKKKKLPKKNPLEWVNALDIALDRGAFSCYNRNDPNWPQIFCDKSQFGDLDINDFSEKNYQGLQKVNWSGPGIDSIIAFLQMPKMKAKIPSGHSVDEIYHYVATYMTEKQRPNWGKSAKRIKGININGFSLDRVTNGHHYFDEPWQFFQPNQFRPDNTKE